MDYTSIFIKVLEMMASLSKWRFVALLFAVMFTVITGILAWRLPEILAVLK